jgi:hypothetical protein
LGWLGHDIDFWAIDDFGDYSIGEKGKDLTQRVQAWKHERKDLRQREKIHHEGAKNTKKLVKIFRTNARYWY